MNRALGTARYSYATTGTGAFPTLVAAGVMAMTLLAVFLPALSPNVLGGQEPMPGGPNKHGQLDKRLVQVTNDTGFYTVRSSIVLNGVEDSFKVELHLGDDLELALKYKESSPELEHRIDVTLKLRDLVEFDDRNGNGRYDPGEEIQLYVISNRTLGPIEYRAENHGADGRVHVLSVSSMDRVFSIRFYMTDELTSIDDQGSPMNVTPSEVKFDINIRNFPFRENASRLAVDGQLLTRENLQFVNQTLDEELNVAADESGCVFSDIDNITGAFLSWANWAHIDGMDRPIQMDIAQLENANGTRRLTLNYPRGNDIFHDPKMGVVINSIGSGTRPVVSEGEWVRSMGAIAVIVTIISAVSVVTLVDRQRFHKKAARRDPFELREYPHFRGKR